MIFTMNWKRIILSITLRYLGSRWWGRQLLGRGTDCSRKPSSWSRSFPIWRARCSPIRKSFGGCRSWSRTTDSSHWLTPIACVQPSAVCTRHSVRSWPDGRGTIRLSMREWEWRQGAASWRLCPGPASTVRAGSWTPSSAGATTCATP